MLTVLVSLAATVHLGAAAWLAGLAYAGGLAVLLSRALTNDGNHRWNAADSITLSRVVLTGGVAAIVVEAIFGASHQMVFNGLAAVALALDFVDGQVARRMGISSRFGARFDMESDSVLALVLCLYLATTLGWWAVSIGLFRYAFVLMSWRLPWMRAQLPQRMSRKVVAAMQGFVLVVCCAALLPTAAAEVLVVGSLASLVWSFSVDISWLWRQASPEPAVARDRPYRHSAAIAIASVD